MIQYKLALRKNYPDMSDEEFNFREVLYSYQGGYLSEDEITREIIISPFDGNYGWAGFVITLNGSPPRALIIYTKEMELYVRNNRSKFDYIYVGNLFYESKKKIQLARATLKLIAPMIEELGYEVPQSVR